MLLSGRHSVLEIHDIVNNEWGYRTRKLKKTGGKPLHPSMLYDMFKNPLYYGQNIRPDGTVHQCAHKTMVTEEEFWRAQILLGRKGRTRSKTHTFAYTGLIQCGECGCAVTAEEKHKINLNGGMRHYIYYHCTKKKLDHKCTQPSFEQKALERQVDAQLERMAISEKFKDWAIKYLKETSEDQMSQYNQITKTQQSAYADVEKKLGKLLDLKLNELITDEEYKTSKEQLLAEQVGIEEQLKANKYSSHNWIELAEKTFDFACHARYWFQNGTLEDKKIILQTIGGSNLSLKDKQLRFEPDNIFTVLANRDKNSDWQG